MEENINKLLKLSDPNKKNGNSFFVIKFEQSLYLFKDKQVNCMADEINEFEQTNYKMLGKNRF